MITFPSAKNQTDSLGVKLVHVPDGIYDRGGKRNNLKEAEKVADLVFEHFKNYPKKTLGVVTFSIAQMDAVEEAIEHQTQRTTRLRTLLQRRPLRRLLCEEPRERAGRRT